MTGVDVFSLKKKKKEEKKERKEKKKTTQTAKPHLKQRFQSSCTCTYMQRRKHVRLDLRVSFIPCRARDYCEERHRYGKKRAAVTSSRRLGSGGGRESFQKQCFLFV